MASGHVNRTHRPNTWLHRPTGNCEEKPCPLGALFRRVVSESGYVEGRNVMIDYRYGEGNYDRLPELAAELVRRQVNVLVAAGGSGLEAKAATTTIPIVAMIGGDPVSSGHVTSLNRPGGNLTGVALFAYSLGPKRLEVLRELFPMQNSSPCLPTLPTSRLGPTRVM